MVRGFAIALAVAVAAYVFGTYLAVVIATHVTLPL